MDITSYFSGFYDFLYYLYNLVFFFRYYNCDICNGKLTSQKLLSKHIRKSHPEIFSFNQDDLKYINEKPN